MLLFGRLAVFNGMQSQLSRTAEKILIFVHKQLEESRAVPSRQEIADAVGYSDKKSLIPYMEELRRAGWREPGKGHRADDWGGTYTRPTKPPFLPLNSSLRFLPNEAPKRGGRWVQTELLEGI